MTGKSQQESFIDMFTKLGRDLKLPPIEVDKIIEHHRKNLEALEKSGRTAAAGATQIAARQREIFEKTLNEINSLAQNYSVPASPQDMMSRQLDFARRSFEMAMENATGMADLMRKSSEEPMNILRERIREGMREINDAYSRKS